MYRTGIFWVFMGAVAAARPAKAGIARSRPCSWPAVTVKRHLDGILTAVVDKVANARAESINAEIQKLKYTADPPVHGGTS